MVSRLHILLVLLLIGASFYTQAQETVVWASEVTDVSSEYGPLEYSAIQALHKPNVLPNGGDNPNAWRPKQEDGEQFITVRFDKSIRAKQVAIGESENPGSVKKVFAYDSQGNEYLLFELTPRAIPIDSRLLNLFFDETKYEIAALKVVLDATIIPGFNSIDAIGISLSNIPINVLINLAPGLNKTVATEKLSENVNSQYIEHSPIISPDGKRLYFSRRYHPDNIGGPDDSEDIWVSDLDEETGTWKPAVNLGPPLNTEGPNFISSITIVEGEEVLILGNRYGKKGRMFTGVSISKRVGDSFQEPTSIEIANEYNYSPKADFFLVPTGEAIVMSQERDDSYGGRDLYVSFKTGATWTEPKNLGQGINTAGEDFAPFLGQDGKTLYYSTTGISGYGGSDIFVSIRLDDSWNSWSVPENLGSSINTPNDDQYFSIPSSGKHIYFARGTMDEDTDIFRFKADELFVDDSPYKASVDHLLEISMTIKGIVYNAKTNVPIPGASVVVDRLPDGLQVGNVTSKSDGSYRFSVRAGARYGAAASLTGFLSQSVNFDFNKTTKSDSIQQDLYLTPIEKGAAIVINNIFFDFDKDLLKTSSYAELNRILAYMKDGQLKKIEISGHTDSVGDDAYNLRLSDKRAKAVFNYLRSQGISEDRMVAKGYGETVPKVANDTKENRGINRRVEFKIIE